MRQHNPLLSLGGVAGVLLWGVSVLSCNLNTVLTEHTDRDRAVDLATKVQFYSAVSCASSWQGPAAWQGCFGYRCKAIDAFQKKIGFISLNRQGPGNEAHAEVDELE